MPLATPLLDQLLNLWLCPALDPSGQGVAQVAAINPAYYLTREFFSVNCIFLYGDLATIRSLGSRTRFRLPATRSGLLLWPLSARPFCRKASPGHRSARISSC